MRKFLILGILVMIFLVPNLSFAWWDTNWQYRAPITIDNTANSNTLTDYQVKVVVDTASLIASGKMNSDCSDMRFADASDVALSYWIESGCNTTNTVVWVKVPSIPASGTTTIYMYYGNPNAVSESNIQAVAYNGLGDDFDSGVLNTSMWATDGGTYSITNGVLSFYSGTAGTWYTLYSTQTVSYPIILRAMLKIDLVNSGVAGHGKNIGFKSITGGDLASFSWASNIGEKQTQTYDGTSGVVSTTVTNDFSNFFIGEIVWIDTTTVNFYYNGTLISTHTTSIPNDAMSIAIQTTGDGYGYFDWVFVRKYTSPEPTTTIGAEEQLSTNQPPQINITYPENKTYYATSIFSTTINGIFYKVDVSCSLSSSSISDFVYCYDYSSSSYVAMSHNLTVSSGTQYGYSPIPSGCMGDIIKIRFDVTSPFTAETSPCYINALYEVKTDKNTPAFSFSYEGSLNNPNYAYDGDWGTKTTAQAGTGDGKVYFDFAGGAIFEVTDDNSTTFHVKAYLNNNLIYDNSTYYNNTIVSLNLQSYLTDSGTYNITVWANDTDGATSQQEVIFTIGDWEIINETYQTWSYETSTETYSISLVYNKDLLGDIGLDFYYNSSYVGTASKNEIETDNGWNATFTINNTHPLIQTNETIVNFEWKINTTDESVATHNQTLVYAYWINYVSVDPSTVVELENFDGLLYYSKMVENSQVGLSASAYAEGTAKSCTASTLLNQFICSDFTASRLSSGITEIRTIRFNFTISYNGDTRVMNDSTTYTVDKIYLAECNATFNDNALNINLYDEITEQQINGSVQVELTAWKSGTQKTDGQSYMMTINATPTAQICAYPTWATLLMDAQIRASSNGFYSRNYYVNDLQFQAGSDVQNVNVYLLNTTEGAYSLLKVYDISTNQPIQDIYIRVQRYSPTQNAYVTMFIDKTNADGIVSTYLVPLTQEYYFELFGEDGTIYATEKDVMYCEVSCPPYVKSFYINVEQAVQHVLNTIQSVITYSDNQLNATVWDKNGVSRTYKFELYTVSPFEDEVLTESQNATGATVVYLKTLDNSTSYTLKVYVLDSSEWVLIDMKNINNNVQNAFGDTGLLMSLILLLLVVAVSLWLESFEMLLLGIGAVVSAMYFLHIFPIGRIAWVSLIVLLSVALYFGRKKTVVDYEG